MFRFSVVYLIFINTFVSSTDLSLLDEVLLTEALPTFPKSECLIQLEKLRNGTIAGEQWALEMMDAWAKPQSGILFGNIVQMGNYDECVQINEDVGGTQIKGKYCSAIYTADQNYNETNSKFEQIDIMEGMMTTYGFCVPKDCTARMLQPMIELLRTRHRIPFRFYFKDEFCATSDSPPFSGAAIVAIVIFSMFALTMVCSTAYDIAVYQKLTEKEPDLCVAFSVLTNGQKLFSTRTSEGSLKFLNGIRVISMMWILNGHKLGAIMFLPQVNAVEIFTWKDNTKNAFFLAPTMSVDTFFTISGFLVAYLHMKGEKKGSTFSLPMFYVHRILRLTPSLAMVVLFTATLLKHMGSGPLWLVLYDQIQKPCERYWWTTLTYIQNYMRPPQPCIGQAWYLAVDTQMYVLSPLILIALVRWPKRTITGILLFVVLNSAYVFEITVKKRLGTLLLGAEDAFYTYIYEPTHVRGTVYLMGMMCGYFVSNTDSRRLSLCKFKVLALWSVSLLILVSIVLAHSAMTKYDYDVITAAIFNSLTRVSWSFALCVIILLCANGYGGFINSFLSWDVFTVLIRLNYSVYLLHMMIIVVVMVQARTPAHFSNLKIYHSFWGDFMFTIGAAIIWTLAFESPVIALEKLLLRGGKNTKAQNSHSTVIEIIHNGASRSSNGNAKFE